MTVYSKYTLNVYFTDKHGGGTVGEVKLPIIPRVQDDIFLLDRFYHVTAIRFLTDCTKVGEKSDEYECTDIEVWVVDLSRTRK